MPQQLQRVEDAATVDTSKSPGDRRSPLRHGLNEADRVVLAALQQKLRTSRLGIKRAGG